MTTSKGGFDTVKFAMNTPHKHIATKTAGAVHAVRYNHKKNHPQKMVQFKKMKQSECKKAPSLFNQPSAFHISTVI